MPAELVSGFLQFTGDAVDSGLTRLETANNWTLTVAVGLLVVVVSSSDFPSSNHSRHSARLRDKLRLYQNEWLLPIKRYQVWVKVLTEFSFGYILAGLIGLTSYDAFRVRHLKGQALSVCIAFAVITVFELARFHFSSPYMRQGPADEEAIRLR